MIEYQEEYPVFHFGSAWGIWGTDNNNNNNDRLTAFDSGQPG